MASLAASTAVYMALPAGLGQLIDMVTRPEGLADLPMLAGVMTGVFVAGLGANVVHDYVNILIGERIAARLRQATFASIVRQDLAFFDATRTGELINRLSADTTLVGKVLSDRMSDGTSSLAMALGSAAMLFVISPQLGTVMVAVVPPIGVAAMAYGDYVERLTERVQKHLSDATVLAEEKLANIRAVRWFVREHQEVERYRQRTDDVLRLARKRSKADALFFGGVDLAVKMSTLGVLVAGGHLVLDGTLTTGELTSFLMYTLYAGSCTAGVAALYSDVMKGIGASTRIFELLAREPKVRNAQLGVSLPAHITGRIQFQDVHFCYPTRPDSAIFRGLNLDVKPNETIALVGPSGCGKSSVIGLLARFYELDGEGCSGRILLDDVDVSTLELSELRGIIGAVRFAGVALTLS
ncbi:hypothetical protein PINS_up015007 [Pythium insidiosum]|nr:hypothetical protein PINS_up015007 [Pythium insidiosum]